MCIATLPSTIVSGGQTGVDRAALDIAIELNMPHSGWCPRGKLAEDGVIGEEYQLKETVESDYITRTRLNVRDSDGTLVLNRGALSGGTAATVGFAKQMQKPYLIINLDDPENNLIFHEWLIKNEIRVLNIAGPRESKQPGIYIQAKGVLITLLSDQPAVSVQAR